MNDVAWLLLLFIAAMIPSLGRLFPPSHEPIGEKHPEAICGVCTATSVCVCPAREARSFVNDWKK